MATKKKSGPQTAAGKVISARNSTKHGLSTQSPSSPREKEIVNNYIQELTRYYKPQSPLEKIQIERIAICKSKLDRLYEVEQVKLQLAIEKFTRDSDQILDQIDAAKGIVRGMVKEIIQYGNITLPCKLKDQELELICEDIDKFKNKNIKESDLEVYLPSLASYLKSNQSVRVSSAGGLIEKLQLIAERIENVFNRQDEYRERFAEYAELIFRLKEQFKPEPPPPTEHELELDRFLEKQKEARDAERLRKHPQKEKLEVSAHQEPMVDQEKLGQQLKLFTELLKYRNLSLEVYKQYQSTKELMSGGITLPQNESDLLMRYQTTLDRRLSTAIGELLHLQSKRTSL
jgi:hypothetical protein